MSKGAFDTLKEGLALARKKGLNVSADPTYRSGLWNYDQDPKATLIELLHLSTVLLKVISQYVLWGKDFTDFVFKVNFNSEKPKSL